MSRLAAAALAALALLAELAFLIDALRGPDRRLAEVNTDDRADEPTEVIDMREVPPYELIPGGWTA